MNHPAPYTAEPVINDDTLSDVRIHIEGKTWHLWGRNGLDREATLVETLADDTLPVFIGSGLGAGLKAAIESGRPVAVIDRETAIKDATEIQSQLGDSPNLLWIDDVEPQTALDKLSLWQQEHGGKPFTPVIIPLYLRIDRPYYGALAETLKASAQTDFWSQARYPKFQHTQPRILFFDSSYFLCGEITSAFKQLNIEYRTIELDQSGIGSSQFVEDLLKLVIDFRPDFALTVNHFGMDREGKLAELLAKLQLPIASWFVDNPHLILHQYAHPGAENTAIFTYDAGNLDQMHAKGFENVHYLPLATDPTRFKPGLDNNTPSEWMSDVSFVGNSMTSAVGRSLNDAALPGPWDTQYEKIAAAFEESGELSVETFLRTKHPEWAAMLDQLPTPENRLALESLITWEATRQYRLSCVSQLLDFSPLIVGDDGWQTLLGKNKEWRHLSSLDYYEDLPRFYPQSKVSFNCTSSQMRGAVNQRIFDVPACGGFIITDHRDQIEDLFDLESEVVVYHHPDEIPDLIHFFLKNEKKRQKVSKAAQNRILSEHTYERRIKKLIATMRQTFS